MKKGNSGFTLVEVIVSIALIGILAVGIIPAFAAQFKVTMASREITSIGFDAQGAIEDAINDIENLLKDDGTYSGTLPTVSKSIFGRNVTLYQLSKDFPLNNNKHFIVFLSEKLAEMAYRDPLVANVVRIDGIKTNGTSVAAIDVASVRSTSNLQSVKGVYTIVDYTSAFDYNLYRWYRSLEGFSDPKFPENYEKIDDWTNKNTITKAELKEDAANRYIMMTFIPVDKSGVRGDEVPSANRVYIQGEDWRSGPFAWIDKNEDVSYDPNDDDVAIRRDELTKTNWALLKAGFDTQKSYYAPGAPGIPVDIADGSLYVPMGVERSQTIDRVGSILVNVPDAEVVDWTVDKSISFANKIITTNNTDISMRTIDGSIAVCQFVDINTSTGEPNYGSNGKVLMYNGGAVLNSDKNISLIAGDIYGSINLEPYTSLIAANSINLTAAEYVTISNSALTAGDNITIQSKKKNITIEESEISADQLNLESNSTIEGGGWDSGTTVSVSDGKLLMIEQGDSKVVNAGTFNLGNTGAIAFDSSMADDLIRPLNLTLTAISTNQVSISTDYGRNVSYANSSGAEQVSTLGDYQDLGAGQSNLEYTIEKVNSGGYGSHTVTFAFDRSGTISIDASGSEPTKENYILHVKDKYADDVIGSINFQVKATGTESPTVTITGAKAQEHTVTFYNGLAGNQLYGNPIHVVDGTSLGDNLMPATPPAITGYNFLGWKTSTGDIFTQDTKVYDDLNVIAMYNAKTVYNVSFCDNFGLNDTNYTQGTRTVYADNNTINSLPTDTWTRTYPAYHIFMGWNSASDCSGTWLTTSTPITGDITYYAQWGRPWANIAYNTTSSYIWLDTTKFQKINDTQLLTCSPYYTNGIQNMTWSDASNLLGTFKGSFNRTWISSSDFLSNSTISILSSTNVLSFSATWWGAQATGPGNNNKAYYVLANGNLGGPTNKTNTYAFRPALTLNNTSRLYGIYVWNATYNTGVSSNPYIIYYK